MYSSENKKSRKKRLPPELAVALKYEQGEGSAPRVVASGQGKIAERIKELAEEADVPLYRDDELAQLLQKVEINEEIPTELFDAVAKVLAYVYRLDKRIGDS